MRTDRPVAVPTAQDPGPPDDTPLGEGFMTAGEIRALAQRARIGPGDAVLDLCCGVGGPGRLVAAETGCRYRGLDCDPAAVAVARAAAGELDCTFEVARVPPLPAGRSDVVLMLETMLAFRDKEPLLAAVAAALGPDGRFAFTVEEGEPLTPRERRAMPAADTVWPVPLPTLLDALRLHGLAIASIEDVTQRHRATAAARSRALEAAPRGPHRDVDDLVAAHRLWVRWLGDRRIRKYAVVAVAVR